MANDYIKDCIDLLSGTIGATKPGNEVLIPWKQARALEAFLKHITSEPMAEMVIAAERWNALLSCARIRMQGSAGVNPQTGARETYDNESCQLVPDEKGWVHFGAEFWSVYPSWTESLATNEKWAKEHELHSTWSKHALTALADDVIKRRQSAALAEMVALDEELGLTEDG